MAQRGIQFQNISRRQSGAGAQSVYRLRLAYLRHHEHKHKRTLTHCLDTL